MNPYDPETNPSGVILMAVAENKLCWDLLKPRCERALLDIPQWTASYGPMGGNPRLMAPLAKFLEKHVFCCAVAPEDLICTTGVSAALSTLFYAICEAGDCVLIPIPYYAAFDNDLRAYAELERWPVSSDSQSLALTPEALETAYAAATKARGRPPKALLLTNPHNPTGRVMGRAELEAIVAWCDAKPALHLVSDEIYALSVFGKGEPFTSLGQIGLGPRRHVVWGMSKDMGMSGLRFGLTWTKNVDVAASLSNAAVFNCVPGPVQVVGFGSG
jgi:aspartate/methionine/tyrosine aminotransferase